MSDSSPTLVAENTAIETDCTAPKAVKVGFVSLGCPKNLVDSEVMMGMLAHAGAELTQRAEQADVIVVNTCSFIESAQQESVNTILEMVRHKTEGRARKIVVAGCLVERFRDEIRKNIPEIDAVVGTGELENILAAAGIAPVSGPKSPFNVLQGRAEGDAREAQGRFSRETWDGAIADLPNYLYDETTPRVLATPGHTAYIKIAEGCDHPCSFCIIPQLRGKFRSRRFESVVAEAEKLARSGVREITLIGQDTTCYGEDFGLKDGLALLLEKLAAIEDLRWVRFLYAYPNKITGNSLETIATHEKICSYIDVPLQHASASVLKRMKRGGGSDLFLQSIEKMRRTIPEVTLRTSFIVGFPGRNRAGIRRALRVRTRSAVRLGRGVWLLRPGGRHGLCARSKTSQPGNRTAAQAPDADPEGHQQETQESLDRQGIRPVAGRHVGRNRSAARRPHRDARAGDRRQSIRQ